MPFSTSSLSLLARAGNFSLWRYAAADDAADLLGAGYFSPAAGILRRGDLIFIAPAVSEARGAGALLVIEAADGRVLLEPLRSLQPSPIAALSDVQILEPEAEQVLTFADGAWRNRPSAGRSGDAHAALHGNPHGSSATDVGAVSTSERGRPGGVATLDADGRVSAEQLRETALANLRDVIAANPSVGDVLRFDGSAWRSSPAAGAAGDAFAASHPGSGGSEAHAPATPARAGFMAAADKQKLDGIEAGATADQTGADLVRSIDGELGGSDWRQGASAWGAFYGKRLGPGLVDKDGAIDVAVANVPQARAISAPAGEDPSVSLELPAAVDRRDFLLAFTATGAVTTTKVATAGFLDALAATSVSSIPNLYVDPVGGDDANDGLTLATAKKTLAQVMTLVEPGATVWLADGVYGERLVVSVSGTEEAPITFRAINRHQAKIRGSTDGSWKCKIEMIGQSYVRIRGVDASSPSLNRDRSSTRNAFWLWVERCSDLIFTDCLFRNAGSPDNSSWVARVLESSDIVFRACTFRKAQTPNSFALPSGDRFLFEGCVFGEALHDPCQLGVSGPVNSAVFRGCVWIGNWGRNGELYNTFDLLFENCIIAHGKDGAMSGSSEAKISGTRTIFRHNMIVENWGGAIEQTPYADFVPNVDSCYYGNVFAFNSQWALRPNEVFAEDWLPVYQHRNNNMRYFNNIFFMNDIYNNGTQIDFWSPVTEGGRRRIEVNRNYIYNGDYAVNFSWQREGGVNLPLCSPDGLASAEQCDNIAGTAPGLADPLLWDFSAGPDSEVRDNGSPLARAVGSGTGRIISVDDVFPFYVGTTIAGIRDRGDLIMVGPAHQVARVVGRDVDQGRLILDRAVDWQSGDHLNLLRTGAQPDIGLIEHGPDARASIHVAASARWIEPGTSVSFDLSARGCVPQYAEWWLGDTARKVGLSVTHVFAEEDDHPIRVRVRCDDGSYRWAVYLITCRAAPRPGAPLLEFTFDDATDAHWWWQWKTYKPAPAQPASSVLDGDLQRHVLEVVAAKGSNPRMPCAIYPEIWDTARYPKLNVKYKCPPGVPLTIKLVAFAKSSSHGLREIIVASTPEAGASSPAPSEMMAADGIWREINLDLSAVLTKHWPGSPTVIKGISIGCWGKAALPGMKYWLSDVKIRV